MNKLWLSMALVVLGSVSACTWVKPTMAAANVHVVGEENLRDCERLGSTTVKVLAKLGFERDPLKVQTELETLARNNAADMNGDSVIAHNAAEDGRQVFDVYRCGH